MKCVTDCANTLRVEKSICISRLKVRYVCSAPYLFQPQICKLMKISKLVKFSRLLPFYSLSTLCLFFILAQENAYFVVLFTSA